MCEIIFPTGIAITTNRTILVSSGSYRIYKIVPTGMHSFLCHSTIPLLYTNIFKIEFKKFEVTVLAGTGNKKRKDGKAEECSFDLPFSIAVHEPSNSCYVTEDSNTIRKILFCKT